MTHRQATVALLVAAVLAAGCADIPPTAVESVQPAANTRGVSVENARASSVDAGQAAGQSTCLIPPRFAGIDIERLPLSAKKIALTFDAGSDAAGVPCILSTLATEHVPATFFLTGAFARSFPVRAARIGHLHLVGNHTVTHPDLTRLTDEQIRAEVQRAQDAILRATGHDPRRFFRFPYGARDSRTIAIVNGRCYVAFRWTLDTLGWKGTSGGVTEAAVVQRVLDAARPGAIVLMHVGGNPKDGSTLDADALPTVIQKLRARGYTFVRLSAVMSAAP